ncbi:tRNA pseudouridine(38-40) synthase TruA [Halomonas sp. CUBES01]|uniref:tRNA pseudouridine synthase A n=1 Tax=Vreelandella gomseomensis TaxID=370766 RepID=A0ABU1GAJ9_9GAMM|nr:MULTISPECIES: tRNA pseudouridine(38-40) synthase TruA [Halomonas]MDR5874517.1 tRNA pseudouridine(38-40) synthase TruA [Halomonas gomseomensis]MEC4767510.1 tRNA pseudouridine(38-40) synthase TruA [Halomonas sp. CUBES01]
MTLFYHFDETQPLSGRLAMSIEYDGTRFCGFQRLKHAASVQASVEDALSKVAGAPVQIHASGRTDSGVHATRQIVHLDPPAQRSEKAWVFGANTNLPRDVSIRWVKPVSDDFHSRLGALGRRYRYLLLNQLSRPVLERHNVTWCRDPLDADAMHRAAQALVGEHDFSSFRAAGCQSKTPWRQMHFVDVKRFGPLVMIDIQGNAFLHHMIRNIAGALVSVGRGAQDEGYIERLLALRNRKLGDVTAPACGLHFVDSIYDERFDLPKEPLGPNLLAFSGEWTGERELPETERVAARRRLTFTKPKPGITREAPEKPQETS